MEHGARRGFVTMCAEGGSVPSRLDHELAMSTYSMIDTVRLRVRYAAKQHSVMRGLELGMDTDILSAILRTAMKWADGSRHRRHDAERVHAGARRIATRSRRQGRRL